jgi:hypothetical protein
MDEKLAQILRELSDMKRQFQDVYPSFRDLKPYMADTRRELGVKQGEQLSDEVDNMLQRVTRLEVKINEILLDVQNTKKLVEYNDVNVKEIMKGLAYIFRNVDELEANLVENRKTN